MELVGFKPATRSTIPATETIEEAVVEFPPDTAYITASKASPFPASQQSN